MKAVKTKIAIENFWEDYQNGMAISEIAKKNGVFPSTYYCYLQEIADSHGVERKALLERNYPSSRKSSLGFTKCKKEEVDFLYIITSCEEYKKRALEKLKIIDDLINKED